MTAEVSALYCQARSQGVATMSVWRNFAVLW